MFCKNCGREIAEDGQFCPYCGTVIGDRPQEGTEAAPQIGNGKNEKEKKQTKKKKRGYFIFTIALIVLFIGIIVVVQIMNGPARKVFSELESGNYASSVAQYNESVKDSHIQKAIFEKLASGYDEEIEKKFDEETIDYKSAVEGLQALSEMGFPDINETLDIVTEINDTRETIKKGNKYYTDGNYEKAIQEFVKIPEENEKYVEINNTLNELYPKYIESIIEQTRTIATNEGNENALAYIGSAKKTALEIIPKSVDISSLESLQEEISKNYKSEVINNVTELISKKAFSEACSTINHALSIEDNEEFQKLKQTVEKSYVEDVSNTVNKYLDEEEYNAASREVAQALSDLPENQTLKELSVLIENSTPNALEDLVVIDSHNYEFNAEPCTDSFGNTYNGYHRFYDVYDTSNGRDVGAIYYLGGEYTSFSGSLIATTNTNAKWTYYAYFYVDGALTYSITGFSKTTGKVDFDISIKGGQQLKIVAGYEQHLGDTHQEFSIVKTKLTKK